MSKTRLLVIAGMAFGAGVVPGNAEPMFLARQYARCTTCHYSPTGGGLLTPYGRSLSRQELSTTGRDDARRQEQGREHEFLWGLLGSKLGPVSLGVDVRPARLHVSAGGHGGHEHETNRDFFMTADVLAAYRVRGWTLYGELGREPLATGAKVASYEYWVAHQSDKGFGFRVGRFLPAYGIRLADHTAFTRRDLGLDAYDQVYGLELSHAGERHLVQIAAGPGRAASVIKDDGTRAFTASGRFQLDLTPRTVVVVSGFYRGSSRLAARNGGSGLAFGFSPWRRLSVWSEADVRFRQGLAGAPAYTLLNETSLEVFRGFWLKFSPQLRTAFGNTSAGTFRAACAAEVLPRTHWGVSVSYYHDADRLTDITTETFLAQLHLYL